MRYIVYALCWRDAPELCVWWWRRVGAQHTSTHWANLCTVQLSGSVGPGAADVCAYNEDVCIDLVGDGIHHWPLRAWAALREREREREVGCK